MNKFPNCEDFLIKELLAEMIKVSYFDAIETKKYKSKYKQSIIDSDKQSALDWFAGKKESPFPFVDICLTVGVEPMVIIESINKKHEAISKLDL